MSSEVARYEMSDGFFVIYNERPSFEVFKVHQKHTDIVVDIKDSTADTIADGVVDFTKKKVIAVVTADCIPVAIEGEQGNAVIHAGWRGLENKILSHSLIKKIKPIRAYIGPCISAKNYEVGEEFKSLFRSESLSEKNGKLFFDERTECQAQLKELFPGISIEISVLCTYDSPGLNSYRQNQTPKRNWNVYIPN